MLESISRVAAAIRAEASRGHAGATTGSSLLDTAEDCAAPNLVAAARGTVRKAKDGAHEHAAAPPAPVMSERRVSLIGALLVAIGPISMALFTPAMPEIVHAFGTTEAAVKMTLSLYFAGFALAQLVCGPLSDGFGRKPVTYRLHGHLSRRRRCWRCWRRTSRLLIAARFLQGVGAAVGWPISRAVVRDLFTNERSARIMNLMGLILGIGPALAPTLGGVTMELSGWHAIFLFMLAAGVTIMLVVRFAMVETVERDLSRIRPAGAASGSYASLLTEPVFRALQHRDGAARSARSTRRRRCCPSS